MLIGFPNSIYNVYLYTYIQLGFRVTFAILRWKDQGTFTGGHFCSDLGIEQSQILLQEYL
jgi:hypothetical protein